MAKPDPAETRFWALIEGAWAECGKKVNAARAKLATRDPDDEVDAELIELVDDNLDEMIANLRVSLDKLDKDELAAMDRVLERKLYEIDRQDVQEFTDGSDDGFLYCRGYIVALGQTFYDAVNATPELAIMDAECADICYLPAHVHEKRFGAFPKHDAGISRESGSNPDGWS